MPSAASFTVAVSRPASVTVPRVMTGGALSTTPTKDAVIWSRYTVPVRAVSGYVTVTPPRLSSTAVAAPALRVKPRRVMPPSWGMAKLSCFQPEKSSLQSSAFWSPLLSLW